MPELQLSKATSQVNQLSIGDQPQFDLLKSDRSSQGNRKTAVTNVCGTEI